ncbi:MAG: dephospho-CoA kinase [Sulfurovaceae bacterium]|nr:dephospho-CoA kinase [Sulfurovaceae bacterium]MDD5549304.1 dephospho-CoA kinase [Sulfurovaceae bacterium]
MKLKYAIALTGGIAVGKSSAMSFMSMYGFRCIDADKIAHDILDEQRDKIASMFGNEVLSTNGVNRAELGKIVFADANKRKDLESLLHPLIYDKIMALAQVEEKRKFPYFIDIPLFFENERYDIDKSLVVYAPKDLQIQRLMKRNSLSYEDAMQRINSQMDIEEKKLKATYIIDNTKDIKHLQNECEKVRGIILEDFKEGGI